MNADRLDNDREAICDVLVAYATAIDSRDWALLRRVFTHDVHAHYGDLGEWHGVDDFAEFMDAAHQGFGTTHHRLTNFVVTIDGDRATARTYVHAVLTLRDDPAAWYDALGHYDDVIVRSADGWRIAERRFTTSRMLSGRSD